VARRPLSDLGSLRAEAKDRQSEALLDAAEQLLTESGPDAVSMRRVADLVGASSQVVITHFTNKQGLADGLLRRGFERLRQAHDAVPSQPTPSRTSLSACAPIGRSRWRILRCTA
jgi:AcrR family transcriptional regulator